MSSGLIAEAIKYLKDRQEGNKLPVHVSNTIGMMLAQRESERFAQRFHEGAVSELGTQFDGIIGDAPVSDSANTATGLCLRFQANRIHTQVPGLCQRRRTSYAAADDEKICIRSEFAGCTQRRYPTSVSSRPISDVLGHQPPPLVMKKHR